VIREEEPRMDNDEEVLTTDYTDGEDEESAE
jgi:hypothetical protein